MIFVTASLILKMDATWDWSVMKKQESYLKAFLQRENRSLENLNISPASRKRSDTCGHLAIGDLMDECSSLFLDEEDGDSYPEHLIRHLQIIVPRKMD